LPISIFIFIFEWKIREIWENFGVEGNFVHDREIYRKQERLLAQEVSWVRSRQWVYRGLLVKVRCLIKFLTESRVRKALVDTEIQRGMMKIGREAGYHRDEGKVFDENSKRE
jgi:hypothetical protein